MHDALLIVMLLEYLIDQFLELTLRQHRIELMGDLEFNSDRKNLWQEYLKNTARWDKLTKTDIEIHNKKLYNVLSEVDKSILRMHKSQPTV